MAVIIIIVIFSVFIRQYTPARGFLCDDVIAYITKFGSGKKAKLIYDNGDSGTTVVLKVPQQAKPVDTNTASKIEKEEPVDVGIDLEDINCKPKKANKDIDVSYLYSNIDDSDEDLKSVVTKALKNKK